MKSLKNTCFLAVSLCLAATTHGAVIATDFFDYGDTNAALSGRGSAGDGWAGAWSGAVGVQYRADLGPIQYTAPGYTNLSVQGAVNRSEGNAGNVVNRSFASELTGTVWISILMDRAANNADGLIWLNQTGGANTFISIRNNNAPSLRYGGTDTNAAAVGTGVHLLLAKIEINASGSNDAISFWVNPTLTGGEAGLGTPLSSSNVDVLGTGLSTIGFSLGTNSSATLDALRVGSTLNAVTSIPEPGTLALVGIMLGSLLLFRRRR